MAVRVPPVLPLPPAVADAVTACMAAKPLQHQDELVQFLNWLATLPGPFATLMEIGTHRGGTLELWCRLFSTCVIGLDLPDGVGGGLSAADMARRNIAFRQRFPHFIGIMGDSHDERTWRSVADALDGRELDLLFIDGDHTYDGVAADYRMYGQFVRPGGVIAFHDVTCSDERAAREQLGVREFFAELPGDKHVFSVGYEWGGIGAIVV